MIVIPSDVSNASNPVNVQWTHETGCALVVQRDHWAWILYD